VQKNTEGWEEKSFNYRSITAFVSINRYMQTQECSACMSVQFTLPSTFCLLWLFDSSIEVNVCNFRFNSSCYIIHVSLDLDLIRSFLGFIFLILLGINFFWEKSFLSWFFSWSRLIQGLSNIFSSRKFILLQFYLASMASTSRRYISFSHVYKCVVCATS
jgi:hypothetical protein